MCYFKEQSRLAGKQEPRGDGALIFDEVTVACQLMWNSCNNKLMGLAMTSTDLTSLNDIYLLLQKSEGSKQTSYVLQFLWRDLISGAISHLHPLMTTNLCWLVYWKL